MVLPRDRDRGSGQRWREDSRAGAEDLRADGRRHRGEGDDLDRPRRRCAARRPRQARLTARDLIAVPPGSRSLRGEERRAHPRLSDGGLRAAPAVRCAEWLGLAATAPDDPARHLRCSSLSALVLVDPGRGGAGLATPCTAVSTACASRRQAARGCRPAPARAAPRGICRAPPARPAGLVGAAELGGLCSSLLASPGRTRCAVVLADGKIVTADHRLHNTLATFDSAALVLDTVGHQLRQPGLHRPASRRSAASSSGWRPGGARASACSSPSAALSGSPCSSNGSSSGCAARGAGASLRPQLPPAIPLVGVAVYGFLVYLILLAAPRRAWHWPMALPPFLIGLIPLSRIYPWHALALRHGRERRAGAWLAVLIPSSTRRWSAGCWRRRRRLGWRAPSPPWCWFSAAVFPSPRRAGDKPVRRRGQPCGILRGGGLAAEGLSGLPHRRGRRRRTDGAGFLRLPRRCRPSSRLIAPAVLVAPPGARCCCASRGQAANRLICAALQLAFFGGEPQDSDLREAGDARLHRRRHHRACGTPTLRRPGLHPGLGGHRELRRGHQDGRRTLPSTASTRGSISNATSSPASCGRPARASSPFSPSPPPPAATTPAATPSSPMSRASFFDIS